MGSEPEIVDATSVELVPAPAVQPTNLFHTDDPAEVVAKASEYADALKSVIERQRLFTNIQGKAHVNVEGWQLLGSMLGVTAVCTHTEKLDNGWKAHVEARTLDGRVVGAADALCTRDEKRGPWKKAEDYALLSMAQTRATSKALKGPLGFVVNLAGYATTPAEEMTFAQEDPAAPEPSVLDRLGQGEDSDYLGDNDDTIHKPTGPQIQFLKKIVTGKARGVMKPTLAELDAILTRIGPGLSAEKGWMDKLTRAQCSSLLDRLTQGALPDGSSDVPEVVDGEFVHPEQTVEQIKEAFDATEEAA